MRRPLPIGWRYDVVSANDFRLPPRIHDAAAMLADGDIGIWHWCSSGRDLVDRSALAGMPSH